MKKIYFFFLAAQLFITKTFAGVYILIDLPEELQKTIEKNQEIIKQKIEEYGNNYHFEKAKFIPHISLVFVDQGKLNIDEVIEKYPNLSKQLNDIANEYGAFDIADNCKHAQLGYWKGAFSIKCNDGKTHENYANVVMKLQENPALAGLACKINELLEKEYEIKQRFPFSAHFTLGRVYCDQDSLVSINDDMQMVLASNPNMEDLEVPITSFVLKAHDGSSREFYFKLP